MKEWVYGDICHGDIFMLNYYGIYVFFEIGDVLENSVLIYELATKKYKNGTALCKKRHQGSKNPFFVLNDNTWTKTRYEVVPVVNQDKKILLPIEIRRDSPIYFEALHRGVENPDIGTFYTGKAPKDVREHYWVAYEEPYSRGDA